MIQKRKIFIFSILLLSVFLLFNPTTVSAGIKDTGVPENSFDESFYIDLFEKINVEEDINLAGIVKERFTNAEDRGRYTVAVINEQMKILMDKVNSASLVERTLYITNLNKTFKECQEEALKKVNNKIEKEGKGDISKVTFDSDKNMDSAWGKLLVKITGMTVKPDSGKKTTDELYREIIKDRGMEDMPAFLRDHVLKIAESEEELKERLGTLTDRQKEFLKESGDYYAGAAFLTDEGIDLMEKLGLETTKQLNNFYKKNSHNIKSLDDMYAIAQNINNIRQDILSEMGKKKLVWTPIRPAGQTVFQPEQLLDENGNLAVWAKDAIGNLNNVKETGYYVEVYENPNVIATLIAKLEKEYGIKFDEYLNIQTDFHYSNTTGDKKDSVQEVENIGRETHTFITKVEFIVKKQSGKIGDMEVDTTQLENLVLTYCPEVANAYYAITGKYVPVPKITKNKKSFTVVLDYYEEIEKMPDYYDIIRNQFSFIRGGHRQQTSVNYKNYVPAIAFKKVTEPGIYTVEANVYARQYVDKEQTYIVYSNCVYEDVEVKDAKGNVKLDKNGNPITRREHVRHGDPSTATYFPYRQELSVDSKGHYSVRTNDKQNVEPEKKDEKMVGYALWTVNVKKNGGFDIPVKGVDTKYIHIDSFITN